MPDDSILWDVLARRIVGANRGRRSVLDRALVDVQRAWPPLGTDQAQRALDRVLREGFEAPGFLVETRSLGLNAAGQDAVGGRYAASHLSHVLEQLLVSTVIWRSEPRWADRYEHSFGVRPEGVMVAAEYSAFTHQRAMYEVFCDERSPDALDARERLGHPAALTSIPYHRWNGPLNSAVAHLASRPMDGVPHRDGGQLKDMVGVLTTDLLTLWRKLAEQSRFESVRVELRNGESRATAASERVAAWIDATPPSDD